MILNPIIPVWLMGIICVILLLFKRKGIFNYIRQILVVILLFAINLRIMVPNGEMTTLQNDAKVLFVVDNTISMLAEDYEGNTRRIDAVHRDCAYIMEQLPGASFRVVSFGNQVKNMIPYTIDATNAKQAVESLQGQSSLHAKGTSMNAVLEYLEKQLEEDSHGYQVVFFISDGEITQEEDLKSFPKLDKLIDTGAVLGYGTEKGGSMKAPAFTGDEDEPEEIYYYDENYDRQTAISKIDESNLKKIASDMGVSYVHMTSTAQIDKTLNSISREIQANASAEELNVTEGYADTYFYLLPALILLLAFDFIYYKTKLKG